MEHYSVTLAKIAEKNMLHSSTAKLFQRNSFSPFSPLSHQLGSWARTPLLHLLTIRELFKK